MPQSIMSQAIMPQDIEHQIRERAYHRWVADGCQDGEADRHWLAAERDVLATFAADSVPASKPRSGRRAANSNVAAVVKAPAKARRRA